MFLFESLLKIERKPNKLYLITKYSIKAAWSESYKRKQEQLQQERKVLFAQHPELKEKDMRCRLLFLLYGVPVLGLISSLLYIFHGYVPEKGADVMQLLSGVILILCILYASQALIHIFSKKRQRSMYEGSDKYHGTFDMSLLYMKTVLVYLLEFIKTFIGYFAFLFIIRLVWSIILLETGLNVFITPSSTLALSDLYIAVGIILVVLFTISILSRTLKKSVVTSWEKLNKILDGLETPIPAIATFVA